MTFSPGHPTACPKSPSYAITGTNICVVFPPKKKVLQHHLQPQNNSPPSDIDFYLQALHLFQQTASSLAIGGHGPNGHPSAGGDHDGVGAKVSSKTAQPFTCASQIHCKRFDDIHCRKNPLLIDVNRIQ